jgi:hypothetical protein
MDQGFENTGRADFPAEDSDGTALVVRQPHPARSLAINVLRFASLLVGAGLLLRTASAEHVVSATQEPSKQPQNQQKPASARLALPQPAFGNAAPGERTVDAHRALAESRPAVVQPVRVKAHEARTAVVDAGRAPSVDSGVEVAFAPVPATHAKAAPGKLPSQPAVAPKAEASGPALTTAPRGADVKPTGFAAATQMASASASPGKAEASAPATTAPRRQASAGGLLAPVRIVSAPKVASAVSPAVSAGRAPAQPVQISLAPPVMRPGPRTTVLTTDVRTAMRRPASAWEYADGLPPELAGRPVPAPRQALAQPVAPQPVVPAAKVSAARVPTAATTAAQQAPAEIAAVRSTAKTIEPRTSAVPSPVALQQQPAPVKAERETSAVTPLAVAAGRQSADAPRPLALLDRAPAPAPRQPRLAPHALFAADLQSPAAMPAGEAVPARSAPLARSDERRRTQLLAEPQYDTSIPDNGPGLQAASTPDQTSASLVLVSVPASEASAGTILADASGGDGGGTSLRDRIPRPAF